MNKPSNYWNMDWSERQEWDKNQRAMEEAEYDRYRAERDAEDARQEAQQARRNYQRQMAVYAEEESYLIADMESKDAQIEALTEALNEARKDAEFMANVWKQYRHDFGEIVNDYNGDPDGIDFVANRILSGSQSHLHRTAGAV